MITAEANAVRSLDPRSVTLWRLTTAARGVLFLAAAVALEVMAPLPLPTGLLSGLIALAAGITIVMAPPLRFKAWSFALRDDHLYLRHGVLFRTASIVPYARIQHVDTRHGPIDRHLHLASLVIFTAGTRGAVLTIPALAAPEAEELRDHLAALSGAGDAV